MTKPLKACRQNASGASAGSTFLVLALVQNVAATVFSPSGFILTFVLRLFFTQTNRLDLVFASAKQGHHLLDGIGTLLTKSQIVFRTAAIIGITLDQDLVLAIIGQEFGVSGDQILILGTDVILVVVEIDAAFREDVFRIGEFGRQFACIDTARCNGRYITVIVVACLDLSASLFRCIGRRAATSD